MSLSSLPTELLRQIIGSTVPSTYQINTWLERQSTLSRLSLVSRLFGQISQPLLYQIIFTIWSEKLHRVLDMLESKEATDVIQQVVIRSGYLPFKARDLERLARCSPTIQSLVLDVPNGGPIDLSVLPLFTNLKTLQLCGTFFTLSSPITLPKLEHLTLDHMALGEVASMLNPTSLPSLKVLGILGDNDREYLQKFSQSQLVELVPKLESLVLPCRILRNTPIDLIPASNRTLFDYYSGVPDSFTSKMIEVRNLRLLGLEVSTQEFRELPNPGFPIQLRQPKEVRDLPRLISAIRQQDPVQLQSLYLDISLESTAPVGQELDGSVEELIRVCREKGIEVVYEEQAKSSIDSIISAEFTRRQKERARRGSSLEGRTKEGDLKWNKGV